MARDAAARLYDVDASSVVLDKKLGTITFRAKKGRIVDLDQLHESIKATRLGDNTGMRLKELVVTAEGEVITSSGEVRLKIPGSDQYFVLAEGTVIGENAQFQRLKKALKRGEMVTSVSGRDDGWEGNLTQFSKKLPEKPRRIIVEKFQTVKP